jgi:D-arabinose 1-dehydrogenase-like Zn-dependent alcohol dehydrogenase
VSGSGVGSIDPAVQRAELPRILDLAASGGIGVEVVVAPLEDVAEAWGRPGRLVVTL